MSKNKHKHLYQNILNSKNVRYLFIVLVTTMLTLNLACDENSSGQGIKAEFSFEFLDDHHVLFKNESVGDYYSLTWEFGNGERDTSTDKKKSYEIYYPQAGSYEVSLKVLNYVGNTHTVSKTINIAETDYAIHFSAEINPTKPNIVKLKNTTPWEYDSLKWLYRHKTVYNLNEHEAYLPFSGSNEIELQLFKNGVKASLKKNVVISKDDAN